MSEKENNCSFSFLNCMPYFNFNFYIILARISDNVKMVTEGRCPCHVPD